MIVFIEPNPKRGAGLSAPGHEFTDYVTGNVSGNGGTRLVKPQQLDGFQPELYVLTCDVFAGRSQNSMTSLNVNCEENVAYTTAQQICRKINSMITAGLDPVDVAMIAFLHRKKMDNRTMIGADFHLGYLNFLLTTGRRWQPYYEKSDRALFVATNELINYDFGLSSPKDPLNYKYLKCVRDPWDSDDSKLMKAEIDRKIHDALDSGSIGSRASLFKALKAMPGVMAVKQGKSTIEMILSERASIFLVGALAKKKELDMEKEKETRDKLARKTRTEYEANYLRGLDMRWERHRKLYPTKNRGIRLSAARVACAVRVQFGDSPMKIEVPTMENMWKLSALTIQEIEYFHRVLLDGFQLGKIDRLSVEGGFAKVFAIGAGSHVEFTSAIKARFALTKAANTGDDEDPHLTCEIQALEVAVKASSSFLRNALKEREMPSEKINERSEPSI